MPLELLVAAKEALMTASPFPWPVARPDSSIVATAGLEVLQDAFTVPWRAPLWRNVVTVYCACAPGAIVSGPDISSRAGEFPFDDPPGAVGDLSHALETESRTRETTSAATANALCMLPPS